MLNGQMRPEDVHTGFGGGGGPPGASQGGGADESETPGPSGPPDAFAGMNLPGMEI